ncbi:MAG TPA: hypothetical protein VEI74_09300 [Candidatus Methylomirabilis sp.]|nr:hypothetical protein [Candidatus Methylomirabilis sp.]
MLPQAHVSHRSAARVRIRVPSRRGDATYFRQVSQQLARCPGVERVEANPVTAGILLIPAVSAETLMRFVESERLFVLDENGVASKTLTETLATEFGGLNQALRRMSEGTVDIGTLAFAALVTGAIVQWQKGHVLGPASTLLWYAAGLLLMTRAGWSKRADS